LIKQPTASGRQKAVIKQTATRFINLTLIGAIYFATTGIFCLTVTHQYISLSSAAAAAVLSTEHLSQWYTERNKRALYCPVC
jgi:hypothetical protein